MNRLHDIEKCALAIIGLERKTRIYHLKKYANCFVGKEAVSFLVNYRFVSTRDEAVNLGMLSIHLSYISSYELSVDKSYITNIQKGEFGKKLD